jgi:hypothetical protein
LAHKKHDEHKQEQNTTQKKDEQCYYKEHYNPEHIHKVAVYIVRKNKQYALKGLFGLVYGV